MIHWNATPHPPTSPPPTHLCFDPPQHYPDLWIERLLPLLRWLRLSLPPRRHWGCSERSAAAGEEELSGHRDWMTGKPQSPIWPIQAPNRDGILSCDVPLSRTAGPESRELRCLALPFSWEKERLVHSGDLKLYAINSRLFYLKAMMVL